MKNLKGLFVLAILMLVGAGCSSSQNLDNKQEVKDLTQPESNEQALNNDTTDEVESIKTFKITAKNWEFIPSTITVNKGDKVRMEITSIDVRHGFSIPEFGVKEDLNPGETIIVEFTADKVGSHTFFCSVYCGSGHRNMDGTLIVE